MSKIGIYIIGLLVIALISSLTYTRIVILKIEKVKYENLALEAKIKKQESIIETYTKFQSLSQQIKNITFQEEKKITEVKIDINDTQKDRYFKIQNCIYRNVGKINYECQKI